MVWQKETITTGEGPLRLHVAGCPHPSAAFSIVALHGFTGSGLDFEAVAAAAQAIPAAWYCPDWPGHGENPTPSHATNPHYYSLSHHLEIIELTINRAQETGIPVILLGYSMGGRLALQWACEHPDSISKLVLIGSGPGLEDPIERQMRAASDDLLANRILADGVPAFLHYWQALPLMQSQQNIPASWQTTWAERRTHNRKEGLAGSLRGCGAGILPSLWEKLHGSQSPCLLVSGEQDQKFCTIMREMQAKLPDARFTTVPQAGHAAHVEQPHLFASLLHAFCQKS